MDLYNALKAVIDFFIQPFLKVLDEIGISEMAIRVGFNNIEWFNISLYNLVELIGSYIILYIFFSLIYKILKLFIRIITGGMRLWERYIISYQQ